MRHKRKHPKDPNKIYRGFRIRLYPDNDQLSMIYKHIHACRFIWNCMLTIQERHHKLTGTRYRYKETSKILTDLKHMPEYSWLNDVSRHSLGIVLNDLDTAYYRFFNGITEGMPKFKIKKKAKKSFPVRYESVYFKDGRVYIEKIGMIKYKSTIDIPEGRGNCKIVNPRLSLNKNGKWVLGFIMECDKQERPKPLCGNMGIDMGIKKLATISYLGNAYRIPNINKSGRAKRLRHKLKCLHRKANRLYKKHGNYDKTKHIIRIEDQMRRISHKLSNMVKNHNQQYSRLLVNMCPRKIIMEDIKIKEFTKNMNKDMRREIYNSAWYDFRCMMEYKCAEFGIQLIFADKAFPSTQICSECNEIKTGDHKLGLYDKKYKCPKCGLKMDRDINATKNLEWYGNFA